MRDVDADAGLSSRRGNMETIIYVLVLLFAFWVLGGKNNTWHCIGMAVGFVVSVVAALIIHGYIG